MSYYHFTPKRPSNQFALQLVRRIDQYLSAVEVLWSDMQITAFQFCKLISSMCLVRDGKRIIEDDLEIVPQPELTDLSFWEKRMYVIHSNVLCAKELDVENFDVPESLDYCLWGVFGFVDEQKKQRKVGFTDFRAYILGVTIGGKDGIDEQDVKPLTLTRTMPCRDLYHMKQMGLYEDASIIIASMQGDGIGDTGGVLRVLDSATLELLQQVKMTSTQGQIMGFDLVPIASTLNLLTTKMKLVFVATADTKVVVFDVKMMKFKRAVIPFKATQTVVRLIKRNGQLIFGSSKGCITTVDVKLFDKFVHIIDTATSFPEGTKITELMCHTDSITCLDTDLFCEHLFTGSLDRTIAQICLKTNTIVRRMHGHELGILSITYNPCYNSLVSSGMEFKVYCWTLEVWNVEPLMLFDNHHPHNHSVIHCKAARNKPLVVSMDTNGFVKVWDLRTLRCVSSQMCEPEMTKNEIQNLHWCWFALDEKRLDLVTAANRKLYVLEYDVDARALGTLCAHEAPVTAARIDTRSRTAITTAKTELQLWDIEAARPGNRVREMATEKITNLLLMPHLGVFVLGLQTGFIKFHSSATFNMLCVWQHQGQSAIVDMCHLPNDNGIACVAATGHVEIIHYDFETQSLKGTLLTTAYNGLPIRARSVIGTRHAPEIARRQRVVVGELDNSITFWEETKDSIKDRRSVPFLRETCKCHNAPSDRRVNCIVQIGLLPVVVAADNGGWVNMWAYSEDNAWPLARWSNKKPPELKQIPTINCMAFSTLLMLLFVGDDFGQINVYDITFGLGATNLQRRSDLAWRDVPSVHQVRGHLVPPLVCSWEAHPESSVTCIEIAERPFFILSAGADCRAQLWTSSGGIIAYLVMKKLGQIADDNQHGIDFSGCENVLLLLGGGGGESPLKRTPAELSVTSNTKTNTNTNTNTNDEQNLARASSLLVPELVLQTTDDDDNNTTSSTLTTPQASTLLAEANSSSHARPRSDKNSHLLSTTGGAKAPFTSSSSSLLHTPQTTTISSVREASLNRSYNPDDIERYNDLPFPYGRGQLLAQDIIVKQTLQSLQQWSEARDEGEGGGALQPPPFLDSGEKKQSTLKDIDLSVEEWRKESEALRKKRKEDARIPFWKITKASAEVEDILKNNVVQRPTTLILPNDEILYSVPQYIGLDRLYDTEHRPTRCAYLPEEVVDRALYGPSEDFKRLADAAKHEAQDREMRVRANDERRLCELQKQKLQLRQGDERLSPRQQRNASPTGRRQPRLLSGGRRRSHSPENDDEEEKRRSRSPDAKIPELRDDGGEEEVEGIATRREALPQQQQPVLPPPRSKSVPVPKLGASFGVGNKNMLRKQYSVWQSKMAPGCDNKPITTTATALGPGGGASSPSSASWNEERVKASQDRALERMQQIQQIHYSPAKSPHGLLLSPLSKLPSPMERRKRDKEERVQKARQRYRSEPNSQYIALDDPYMIVPSVRTLQGSSSHVKTHSAKPF